MIETDINYPASLPNPQRANHDASHVSPFGRTGMASGRARQRRKFTSVPSVQAFEWIFTDAQAQSFEAWFRDTINDGADWFSVPRKTPLGMSALVCRFVGMYQGPNLWGVDRWRFSADLEAYERPLLPPGWGLIPDIAARSDIFDRAMNDRWPKA